MLCVRACARACVCERALGCVRGYARACVVCVCACAVRVCVQCALRLQHTRLELLRHGERGGSTLAPVPNSNAPGAGVGEASVGCAPEHAGDSAEVCGLVLALRQHRAVGQRPHDDHGHGLPRGTGARNKTCL